MTGNEANTLSRSSPERKNPKLTFDLTDPWLASTEHCVHKTFRAQIDFTWKAADGTIQQSSTVDGLLNQYIRAATDAINPDWLHSAFVDDAGIIAFDDTHDLAFKVETHNHPQNNFVDMQTQQATHVYVLICIHCPNT